MSIRSRWADLLSRLESNSFFGTRAKRDVESFIQESTVSAETAAPDVATKRPKMKLETLNPLSKDGKVYLRESDHKYFFAVKEDAALANVKVSTTVTGMLDYMVVKGFFGNKAYDVQVERLKSAGLTLDQYLDLRKTDPVRAADLELRFGAMALRDIEVELNPSGEETALEKGKRVHHVCELYYNDLVEFDDPQMNGHELSLFKLFVQMPMWDSPKIFEFDPADSPYRRELAFRTELTVAYEPLSIGGQIDIVYRVEGEPNSFAIGDYKTGKDLYGTMTPTEEFKAAFPNMRVTTLTKYGVQLAMYAAMFMGWVPNSKVTRIFVIWLGANVAFPQVVNLDLDSYMPIVEWLFQRRAQDLAEKATAARSTQSTGDSLRAFAMRSEDAFRFVSTTGVTAAAAPTTQEKPRKRKRPLPTTSASATTSAGPFKTMEQIAQENAAAARLKKSVIASLPKDVFDFVPRPRVQYKQP